MHLKCLAIVVCSILLTGCATLPPQISKKVYAIENAKIERESGDFKGVICRLPPNKLDFVNWGYYDLFARLPMDSPAQYLMTVAAVDEFFNADAEVTEFLGSDLIVHDRRDFSAMFYFDVDYIEVEYSRDFLENAAMTGARFLVKSSRGSLSFEVSKWMFAALLEVADQHDEYARSLGSKALETNMVAPRMEQDERTDPDFIQTVDNPIKKTEQADSATETATVLTEARKNRVPKNVLTVGMIDETLRILCGEPERVIRTVTDEGVFEQWIYKDYYLFFLNNALTSWQDISED